jgi:class I fructose-bisphosphate aldolase
MSVDFFKDTALLGDEAETLLCHVSKTISKDDLHLPAGLYRPGLDEFGPHAGRAPQLAEPRRSRTLERYGLFVDLFPSIRGSSIRAVRGFAPNPQYFDPQNIVKLAIDGGCNASRFDVRCARVGRSKIRAQDPVHREIKNPTS